MNRLAMLAALEGNNQWDIVIIGGGATGLGAAVDAASRCFKTLLVEKDEEWITLQISDFKTVASHYQLVS